MGPNLDLALSRLQFSLEHKKAGKRMGSLGMQEIIIIFVLALIIFGPRKLPEIGKSLGKGLQEFKKASNDLKRTWEEEVQLDKEKETMSNLVEDASADLKRTWEDAVQLDKEKESVNNLVEDDYPDLKPILEEEVQLDKEKESMNNLVEDASVDYHNDSPTGEQNPK
jgi:TatA/E family protein of Tat protein translocase